jgi:hypothetical protein
MNRTEASVDARTHAFYIVFLVLITLCIFSYTVSIRSPWFGTMSDGHHQWLSGSTLKFAKNWVRDGAFRLGFSMVENPRSVEFPTFRSREIYLSYPPGTVVPIFLLSRLVGHEPTPGLLMAYNLANHFLITLILALTLYVTLLRINLKVFQAFGLSLVPIIFYLLLPGPLYWHQNVFFADQAIILPFVMLIFLEVLRRGQTSNCIRTSVYIFQALVLFYGTLTDWLFVFVALVTFIIRLFSEERNPGLPEFGRMSVSFLWPVAAALVLFTLQLASLGVLHNLVEKFMFRTGFGEEGAGYISSFFDQFWIDHLGTAFKSSKSMVPAIFLWLNLAVFFYYAVRRVLGGVTEEAILIGDLVGMLLLPCFLQVYALRNHSVIHDFSALKFAPALATIPLVLLPILLLCLFRIDVAGLLVKGFRLPIGSSKFRVAGALLPAIPVALSAAYVIDCHNSCLSFFPKPNYEFCDVGGFVARNTDFRDVVFSQDLEVPINPPQWLSYTMKRVYKTNSILGILEVLRPINDDYVVNIFVKDVRGSIPEEFKRLLNRAEHPSRREGSFVLYKISKACFRTATD